MAAKELARNMKTSYSRFYIDDYEKDAPNLPTSHHRGKGDLELVPTCSIGSTAIDSQGNHYMLNGNDEWVRITSSTSGNTGNGGGDGMNLDFATDQDILNMLEDVF